MSNNSTGPLVTVGLPVYNGQQRIGAALKSLTRQTYRNLEIIVSDNHSADHTIERIRCIKDRRIRLFRRKANLGPGPNFNFVLSRARGRYFMWAAHDDIWEPEYITELVKLLVQFPEAILAASGMLQTNDIQHRQVALPFRNFEKGTDALSVLLRHPDINPALFYGIYRTDVLRRAGGMHVDSRPLFGGVSDGMTVLKVLLHGDLVCSDRIMYQKTDSGLYLAAYETLHKLDFSLPVMRRIARFLILPVMFGYDLIQTVRYLWGDQVTLTTQLKLRLSLIALIRFLEECSRQLYAITRGMITVFLGLTRRIIMRKTK